MPMKTIEGYSKEKYTDASVLLAGGGAKALSGFIGKLSWDSTNKKIKYTPIGKSETDLVTLSWDNIANRPTSLPANGGNADTATNLIPENTAHYFRDPNNSAWRGGMIWGSAGNESMSFVVVNSNTRFQFVGGSDIANWNSSTWQSANPYLTIYSSGIVTPGSATASGGFIKSGYDDTYVLLAGGGHKLESNLSVKYASSAGSVTWENVTGKPDSFTPSFHTHNSINGSDNRSVNNTPNWYMTNIGKASIYTEFCMNGGAISSTYENRTTFTPWGDNSGEMPVQLAFNNSGMFMRTSSSSTTWNAWNTIWHSGNDGSGSGLDADKLDGYHASSFVQTSGDQSISGIKTFNNTIKVNRAESTTGFFQTSDFRKKNILGNVDEYKAYHFVKNCKPIVYELKDDETHDKQLGLIAQEVEEYFPELVITDENGFKSMDYSRLSVVLFTLLKDLIKRNKL